MLNLSDDVSSSLSTFWFLQSEISRTQQRVNLQDLGFKFIQRPKGLFSFIMEDSDIYVVALAPSTVPDPPREVLRRIKPDSIQPGEILSRTKYNIARLSGMIPTIQMQQGQRQILPIKSGR